MQGSFDSTAGRQQAARDPLTAAFARPHFMKLLTNECRFALEMGKPFSIALIDIDQMRKLNDRIGITAGDAMLAGAAEAVRAVLDQPQWHNLRALMGRFDGDSLMLLLPGCRLDRAEQFAWVVKQHIARIEQDGCGMTASLAIAAFKRDDSIDELLARVEKTLCLAKQFGGDAVEVACASACPSGAAGSRGA
jgi:diguanylate cyclase (GGDEF)-like protein